MPTFNIDQQTLDEIAKLRDTFGAKDDVEVIRKALALAKIASENMDATSRTLTIVTPNDVRRKVALAN